MLNEIGSEDLVGELIRSVLSLVVARFRPSSDKLSFQTPRRGVDIYPYACIVVLPACVRKGLLVIVL
jgi:hypothetical protein